MPRAKRRIWVQQVKSPEPALFGSGTLPRKTQYELAIEAWTRAGEHGATGDAIEFQTGIPHQSLGSILLKARKLGVLVELGDKAFTRRRKLATVWKKS